LFFTELEVESETFFVFFFPEFDDDFLLESELAFEAVAGAFVDVAPFARAALFTAAT
jgi:hypothetical protein